MMVPHRTPENFVDYYECSECGWAYPFPRFVKERDANSTNEQMARKEFTDHDCKKYPRTPKSN